VLSFLLLLLGISTHSYNCYAVFHYVALLQRSVYNCYAVFHYVALLQRSVYNDLLWTIPEDLSPIISHITCQKVPILIVLVLLR
jgi:hypothetical protein